MRRKAQLTAREHMVVGADLAEIQDRLMAIANLVGPAYGAPYVDKFLRISRAIDKVKSKLDDVVCREYPMTTTRIENVPITSFYYNWRRGPDNRWGKPGGLSDRTEELRERAARLFDDGNPWAEPKRPTQAAEEAV